MDIFYNTPQIKNLPMNWLIVFLIFVFIYILFSVKREHFESYDSSCQTDSMQTSINQNSENITDLQNQVVSLQDMINDISGNLSSLTDEVNTLQTQQASIVSATSPSTITGTD